MSTLQEKFGIARREMMGSLIERDQEIDIVLTAAIARESALLVGQPGTAKSLLADAVVRLINGQQFTVLLTKFSTPEEVFGPVSVKGLKEDIYRRILTGKMPTCHVAFIDEVFKASSAILNTMLNILNERIYRNDGEIIKCPMRLCIAASNEWPGGGDGNGKELGALFDRFLLRQTVKPIATAKGLDALLWNKNLTPEFSVSITPEEVDEAADAASKLEWTTEAKEAFLSIIRECRAEGILPGDRRLRKAVGVAKAYAYLCGQSEVTCDSLEILSAVLWDDPQEQPRKAAEIVARIANPVGAKINGLLLEAEEILGPLNVKDLGTTATACKKLQEIHKKLKATTSPRAAIGAEHVAAEIKRLKMATIEAL